MQDNTVEHYYKRALSLIVAGEERYASKLLLEKMPVKLYDEAMNILFNYNSDFKDEDLRTLIRTVDEALCNFSEEENDDNFIDDTF